MNFDELRHHYDIVPVVRELFYGNHRFSDLVALLGAPRTLLSGRLRKLTHSVRRADGHERSDQAPRFRAANTRSCARGEGSRSAPLLSMKSAGLSRRTSALPVKSTKLKRSAASSQLARTRRDPHARRLAIRLPLNVAGISQLAGRTQLLTNTVRPASAKFWVDRCRRFGSFSASGSAVPGWSALGGKRHRGVARKSSA